MKHGAATCPGSQGSGTLRKEDVANSGTARLTQRGRVHAKSLGVVVSRTVRRPVLWGQCQGVTPYRKREGGRVRGRHGLAKRPGI